MRSLALAVAVGLATAGSASAELAVPKVQDGMLAVSPSGTPFVAYLHGNEPRDLGSQERRAGRGSARRASRAARHSSPSRPADEARSCSSAAPGSHSLDLVRRTRAGWQRIPHRACSDRLEARLAGSRARAAGTRWSPSRGGGAPRTGRRSRSCGSTSAAARTPCRSPGAASRRASSRPPAVPGARGPHGSRDRVVRHRRSGRDDRVASAERHLEGPVHRRGVRRLPGRAASGRGRRQRGVRSVDAGTPRRGRPACVAREARAVDRERLRPRSSGHDRLRADPDRTGGCGERMGVRGRPRAHGRRRRLGRCRREPPRRLPARRLARRPLLGPTRYPRRASGQARWPLVVPAAARPVGPHRARCDRAAERERAR